MKSAASQTALCGVVLLFAAFHAEQSQHAQPAATSESGVDIRRLDDVFLLIERDLAAVIGDDGRVSHRDGFERLAATYRIAAEQNDRKAKFKLGALYLEGLVGIQPDCGMAAQWFRRAGGADHPFVHLAMGRFHLQGSAEEANNSQGRSLAIDALGKIGPAAAPAIGMLEDELINDRLHGNSAAVALGRMGEPAVPILIEALRHKNAATRRGAAEGLLHAGAAAHQATGALTEALDDEDSMVRDYVRRALNRLQTAREGE